MANKWIWTRDTSDHFEFRLLINDEQVDHEQESKLIFLLSFHHMHVVQCQFNFQVYSSSCWCTWSTSIIRVNKNDLQNISNQWTALTEPISLLFLCNTYPSRLVRFHETTWREIGRYLFKSTSCTIWQLIDHRYTQDWGKLFPIGMLIQRRQSSEVTPQPISPTC